MKRQSGGEMDTQTITAVKEVGRGAVEAERKEMTLEDLEIIFHPTTVKNLLSLYTNRSHLIPSSPCSLPPEHSEHKTVLSQ